MVYGKMRETRTLTGQWCVAMVAMVRISRTMISRIKGIMNYNN